MSVKPVKSASSRASDHTQRGTFDCSVSSQRHWCNGPIRFSSGERDVAASSRHSKVRAVVLRNIGMNRRGVEMHDLPSSASLGHDE